MALPEGVFALKVDVDTRSGLERGVPALLELFGRFGLRATFFMSWGPDRSGRALLKLLRNPRFLWKMLRTNAAATYGLKTALRGVLLPAAPVGAGRPDIVRAITEAGHELELHAWDHRTWQDTLERRDRKWVDEWFAAALEAHRRAAGKPPRAFGAPAWLMTDAAWEAACALPFDYFCCTRAPEPFLVEPCGRPELGGGVPCLEETGDYGTVLEAARKAGGGVITLHAEVEGGRARERFAREFLEPLLSGGARLVTTGEFADMLDTASLPRRRARPVRLPGRADPCCA